MPKQPFTPDGLNAKRMELYALSDAALAAQAKILAADFKTFMSENFTFSTGQAAYLAGIPDAAAAVLGGQLAAAVLVRGEITMDPAPPNPEPERPKEIKIEPHGTISYNNSVPGTAGLSGTLSVHISWALL